MLETDLSNQLISYIVSLKIFSDSSIIWRESTCMFETDLSNQLISYIVSLKIFSDSSIIWRVKRMYVWNWFIKAINKLCFSISYTIKVLILKLLLTWKSWWEHYSFKFIAIWRDNYRCVDYPFYYIHLCNFLCKKISFSYNIYNVSLIIGHLQDIYIIYR